MKKEKEYSNEVNRVDGFNPFDHLTQIVDENGDPCVNEKGEPEMMLPVDAQHTWFALYAASQGKTPSIQMFRMPNKMGDLEFKAVVYLDYKDAAMATEFNRDAGSIGSGYGLVMDSSGGNRELMAKLVAAAQTKARGAALKAAGFGPEISMKTREKIVGSGKANLSGVPAPAYVKQIIEDAEKIMAEQPAEVEQPAEAEQPAEDDAEDDQEIDAFMSQLLSSGVKIPADQQPPKAVEQESDDEAEAEAETVTAETPSQETPPADAGKYVITDEDAASAVILEPKVGQKLEDLGPDLCQTVLDNLSEKLPEPMRKALETYVAA